MFFTAICHLLIKHFKTSPAALTGSFLYYVYTMWYVLYIAFLTSVNFGFLFFAGICHQCHLLWQHITHHLPKIQQILWPTGKFPTYCVVWLAFPSHPQFYSDECIFSSMSRVRTCWIKKKKGWCLSHAPVLHHVYAHVLHASSPRWINVCVSNWSGSWGDMVCIPYPELLQYLTTPPPSLPLTVC